jgi:hypothetical protein
MAVELFRRSMPSKRRRWRLFLVTLALFVALPPAAAYAYVQINYGSGVGGPGVVVSTGNPVPPEFANRQYNRVWHLAGKTWTVWYQDTSHQIFCNRTNSNNPTSCPNFSSNKKALAQNVNDNSTVTWTAQTTKP